MTVIETALSGVLLIEPRVFGDERGYFFEAWNAERCRSHGIDAVFVQDNVSFSRRGIIRGLHFQNPSAQAKLVSVLAGSVFDVAVDVRLGSPTFGQWVGVDLSAENHRQLFIPEGFAHGFAVTSETALFSYKCSCGYSPGSERTIRWDDPDLDIGWPVSNPVLSPKDAAAPSLREMSEEQLFAYADALV